MTTKSEAFDSYKQAYPMVAEFFTEQEMAPTSTLLDRSVDVVAYAIRQHGPDEARKLVDIIVQEQAKFLADEVEARVAVRAKENK